MNLVMFDNVIEDPKEYVRDILSKGFEDFNDGSNTFHGMQPRGEDEFCSFLISMFPEYSVNLNFIRQSPEDQNEPNYIHRDDMMGEITAILYLNENPVRDDGTIIYDEDVTPCCRIYSKFNRMIAFDSDALHSRSLFSNFGSGETSRLVQVVFLSPKEN
jgi:hypothetical protein